MTRKLPRRALEPEARRQQILEAALAVFARKGYQQASITDIIEAAGVARGTFYLYFDSKERVFLVIVETFYAQVKQAFTEMDDAAAAALAEGPRQVLKASFRRWLEFFASRRDVTRVVLREAITVDPRYEPAFLALRKEALARFADRFRTFQALGLVNPAIDPVMAAHFQLGMFDELLNAFVVQDVAADLDAIAGQLADFEWNGIRNSTKE